MGFKVIGEQSPVVLTRKRTKPYLPIYNKLGNKFILTIETLKAPNAPNIYFLFMTFCFRHTAVLM